MPRRTDKLFWQECAQLYCKTVAETFAAAAKLTVNFKLPDTYIEQAFKNSPNPVLVREILAKLQPSFSVALRLELLKKAQDESGLYSTKLLSDDFETRCKWQENFPQKLSKSKTLERAIEFGRADAVHHIVSHMGWFIDSMINDCDEVDADEDMRMSMLEGKAAHLTFGAQSLSVEAVIKLADTMSEIFKVLAKYGCTDTVDKSYKGWGAYPLAPFEFEQVDTYLQQANALA